VEGETALTDRCSYPRSAFAGSAAAANGTKVAEPVDGRHSTLGSYSVIHNMRNDLATPGITSGAVRQLAHASGAELVPEATSAWL